MRFCTGEPEPQERVRDQGRRPVRKQSVDRTPLQTLFDANTGRAAQDDAAGSWKPFRARPPGGGCGTPGTRSAASEIDAARAALTAAEENLVPAVVSIDSVSTPLVYGVGGSFAAADTVVTVTCADGSTATLTEGEYSVSGFTSSLPGEVALTFTAAQDLAAIGATPPSKSLTLEILPLWSANSTYNKGDAAFHDGSKWVASWWTKNQTPGAPNGPWQEHVTSPEGMAVWTPSRIFVAGDVVTHEGNTYTAKWRTRNQAPGDPNGPWSRNI